MLTFKQRIISALILAGLVPMVTVAGIALYKGYETSLELSEEQMEIAAKAAQEEVEEYFNTVQAILASTVANPETLTAMKEFSAAMESLDLQQIPVNEKKLNERYAYQQENTPGSSPKDAETWMVRDGAGRTLQSLYIAQNPNKIGEKDKLDVAGDGSTYSRVHKRLHPYLHALQQRFGFYDVFLVNKATGRVVYTVFKELDFMGDLNHGYLADSGLARVVKKAMESNDPNAYFIDDFAPYIPSYNLAASFVAAPLVEDGKTVGAVAFQLPSEKMAEIFKNVKTVDESANGYFVAGDGTLRTDQPKYNLKIGQILPEHVKKVFDEVKAAGKGGIRTYTGLSGKPVFGAVYPLDLPGLDWSFSVTLPESSLLQPIYALLTIVGIVVAVSMVVTTSAGVWIAGVLTKPVQGLAINFNRSAERVGRSTSEVSEAVSSMVAASEETSRQSEVIRKSSNEAAAYVNSVSNPIEELNISINDISRSTNETNVQNDDAVAKAQRTDEVVRNLGEAGKKISEVVSLINDLAEQTNLLALNAAIEAARAGDAGRGFAVVADEVEKQVRHTSDATVEISTQIKSIQQVSEQSVQALKAVVESIHHIRDNATTVSAAVEEQGSVVKQIAGSVRDASGRVQAVDENMTGIEQAANDTGVAADQVSKSAGDVQQAFGEMRRDMGNVLTSMGVKV